eukprot:1187249-Prorocentrum_minimum.AAC.1
MGRALEERYRGCPSRVPTPGICSPPSHDWLLLRVYALHPHTIGSYSGYMLSTLTRLAPTPGICSPPAHDWLLLASEGSDEPFAARGALLYTHVRRAVRPALRFVQATHVTPHVTSAKTGICVAPELVTVGGHATAAADVFSLAVLVYE